MNSQFLKGYCFKYLGVIGYLLGGAIILLIAAAGKKASRWLDADLESLMVAGIALVVFCLAIVILKLSHIAVIYGKKVIASEKALLFSQQTLQDAKYVLYLRSFIDDAKTSNPATVYSHSGVDFEAFSTEEEHLNQVFSEFGEMVAIGSPDEPLPNLGALRLYADASSWQDKVIVLMQHAELVVIRLGQGDWLWWEVERAFKLLPRNKLCLLTPQKEDEYQHLSERFATLTGWPLPRYKDIDDPSITLGAIVHFNDKGIPELSPLLNLDSVVHPTKPLLVLFQTALLPIYQKLGKPWQPPKIPAGNFVRFFLASYVSGLCLVWLIILEPIELTSTIYKEFFVEPEPDIAFASIMLIMLALLIGTGGFFGRFVYKFGKIIKTMWTYKRKPHLLIQQRDKALRDYFS